MPKICFLFLTILLFAFTASARSSFGSGTHRNPYEDLFVGSPLLEFRADILDKNRPAMTRDTLIIDFASRQVTFSRVCRLTGMSLWQFHYAEIDDYFRDMENHTVNSLWYEIVREQGRSARDANRPRQTGLTFAVPANLPRWATRILGQEPPKLAITGTQKLLFGVNRTISGTKGNPENRQVSPEFKPTSDFNIKGSVGRLLHLEINLRGEVGQDDFFQQARDQLSQIRIHYREEIPGELEDDIIQEVEIGKTSFQMPGQGLAGYSSGSNENLFGIRVRSKLGPLELTTIASIENVETQRKTINSNEQRASTISELDYLKNQFFYLHEGYKLHAEGKTTTVPLRILTERVHIFRRVNHFPPDDPNIRYVILEDGHAYPFRRLVSGTDYEFDGARPGVIRFMSRLNDADVIAVISEMEGLPLGSFNTEKVPFRDEHVLALNDVFILKKDNQRIGDPTYNLMLRNVYYVGTSDEASFDLKIFRQSSDGQTQEQNDAGEYFTNILKLAREGVLQKTNRDIFDLENGFMFIPPFTTTRPDQNANWVFTNDSLGRNWSVVNTNPAAYDDAAQNVVPLYQIVTRSRKRMDRFNLDFGIVEGTERLWTPGGDSLVRNVDYTIDYGFGQVILLSPKALAAEVIEASYQKESLFLLDKKVFIGISGKLDLPGVGRNSYMGTTVMWQLMDAKKMMPRVGTEPYNRFLFASNLRLDFAPLWMTSAINYIPLIEREAQSSATFDFEVAHSSVKSSARSGGEASIDNFSTSARTYALGTSHTVWYRAGPDHERITPPNSFIYNPPAWHWYWYQPAAGDNRAYRREIYPPENASSHNDRMNTLKLVVQPFPENQSLREGIADSPIPVEPWAGISHGFSSGLMNRSEDRYFEFWIRTGNARGTLTIDFGEVGENLSLDGGVPTGRPSFESYSGTVSAETDLGIDGFRDDQEYWLYPRFENGRMVWDTLRYGDSRLGEWQSDPARDNWALYDRDNLENRKFANGTQGNRSVNPRPDSEDIDGDGRVTMEWRDANYFRYTIDLNALRNNSSPFRNNSLTPFDRSSGWIHVRIPIGDAPESQIDSLRRIGVYEEFTHNSRIPDWSRIRHVRMLWSGMENRGNLDSLEFEGIQFVGNVWREQVRDDSITGTVIANVIDSRTKAGYLFPHFKRLDSLSGEQAVDYTLRLEYNAAPSGRETMVSRKFERSQAMNLTNYRAIKFWAMEDGYPNTSNHIRPGGDVWFVLRFGSDSATYYEYKTRRFPGWNNEGFTVDLEELTKLKLDWFNNHGERHDSINAVKQTRDGDFLRVYTETRVAPTLSSISWIAFGIENNSGREYTGNIHINGFRTTGISDYSGWATRATMKLNWSDFIENTANFRYHDASFRSMSDNVLKQSSAQVGSGVGSKIQLDRFLPDRFGVNLPLGGEITASLERPEVRPNSDIPLRNDRGTSDGLRDMTGDFGRFIVGADERGGVTESQKYERRGRNRSAYTGYRKNRTSEKVVPRLTADRIGVDYRLNYRDSIARMGEVPQIEKGLANRAGFEQYHAEISLSQNHNAGLDYNFSPSKKVLETASWSPFVNAKSPTLHRRIRTMSFNLLPERVVFDVAQVNYSKRESYSSIQDVIDMMREDTIPPGQYYASRRPVEEVGMTHGMNITYKPINPFVTINYNLGINRNFDQYIRHWDGSGISDFANSAVFRRHDEYHTYNVLFSEQRRNQDIRLSLTPEITRWLTLSSNSTGGYTQNMEVRGDTATYMRTTINSAFDINSTFNIRRLFEDLSRRIKKNEGLSNGFGNVAKGFEKVGFESLGFTYRATMGLGNTFLDTNYLHYGLERSNANYMLYSFGVFDRSFKDFITGNMNDGLAFGGVQNRNNWYYWYDENGNFNPKNASDTRNTSQSVTGSTSMRIPRPVDISINTMMLGWTRTYSITPELNRLDTSITFPDIRIGANSTVLEQLELIKQNFSTFRLDWGYTYRHVNARTGRPWDIDSTSQPHLPGKIEKRHTISWGFTPLIKTTMRLRRPGLDLSYSLDLGFDTVATYDSSFVIDEGRWRDSLTRASQKKVINNNWTAGYHIPGRRGRTIRLFRDQIVDINGDMDFTLSIGYTRVYYRFYPERNLFGENENYDETTVTINPQWTYRFTRNIDARVWYALRRSITGKDQHFMHNGRVAMEITISF